MRDDSSLNTGATSASFGVVHEQTVRTEKSEEKKERRTKLQPAADVVFAEIKAEMDSVMFINNIDIANAKDEKMFMVEMMARQKYVKYLKQLQNKLDNILREPKIVKPKKVEELPNED